MLNPFEGVSQLTSAELEMVQELAGLSYSDGDIIYYDNGQFQRLAIGTSGQSLIVSAGLVPSWSTPAAGGDVTKVGTPANNQMAVWTGDGTLEGTSDFTFDGTNLNLITGKNFQIARATILSDSAGTTTLSNIDALDATTEATIEGAIDTLANLTSIQGRTVTLADAGANAIFGWDDTAGAYENLSAAEALAATGVTASATELNYVGGVTSAIQTQLDQRVTAASTFATDNSILRSDGTGRGAKSTGVFATMTDAGGMSLASIDVFSSTVPPNGVYRPAANSLGLSAGSTGRVFLAGSALSPVTTDGYALGTTANQWSDLFLAEGGVINWDNGDATLTQSGNTITFGGITTFNVGTTTSVGLGTIEVGHASDTTITRVSAGKIAVEGVNVVTTSSTDTLTNKTIALGSNTVSGTTAQFNTALTDGDFATLAGTETLTNKKIDPRVETTASTATYTFNRANYDKGFLTAQAAALTIANSTNTSVGDTWSLSILDNGTARALTFGTDYVGLSGLALPTTTTVSKWMEIIFSKVTSTKVLVSYVNEA